MSLLFCTTARAWHIPPKDSSIIYKRGEAKGKKPLNSHGAGGEDVGCWGTFSFSYLTKITSLDAHTFLLAFHLSHNTIFNVTRFPLFCSRFSLLNTWLIILKSVISFLKCFSWILDKILLFIYLL